MMSRGWLLGVIEYAIKTSISNYFFIILRVKKSIINLRTVIRFFFLSCIHLLLFRDRSGGNVEHPMFEI